MNNSPHLSSAQLREVGVPDPLIRATRYRSEILRARGFPVLYTLKHLALSTDTDWGFLRGVIRRDFKHAYQEFRLPKSTGGTRKISAPTDQLMRTQRWILDQVLVAAPRHPNSFAYHRGVRMLEAAQRHVGARWMIKADLHNFFPSVSERRVYGIFREFGYAPLFAFELARLCTWPADGTGSAVLSLNPTGPYFRHTMGALPQGAPTSGALANLACRLLDEDLSRLAIDEGLIYTRYSDDIAMSGSSSFDRSDASNIIREVRRIVSKHHFVLHEKKLKLIPPGARKTILGMLVGSEEVRILPEQRRMIDLYIHGVEKYSLPAYAAKRKFDSPISFINHVNGHFAHMKHIEPEWVATREALWVEALEQAGIFPEAIS